MISGWPSVAGCSVLAHRGGGASAAPNTRDAVLRAALDGAHAVELDVQELGDGTLVVHHDGSLLVGGVRQPLAGMTLAEFAGHLPAAPWTFAAMLRTMTEIDLGLYLDVKWISIGGLLGAIDSICSAGLAARSVVGSFDRRVVGTVALDGRLRASVLYRDHTVDPVDLALHLGCAMVHPCFDDQPEMVTELAGRWVERVHEAGLAVVGWNANEPSLLMAMRRAGFDAICTDDARLAG